MNTKVCTFFIAVLIIALAGATQLAAEQHQGMEMHGESDEEETQMRRMDKEAMKKCRERCMALQKTLEEVQAMIEEARGEGEEQKVDTLLAGFDKLVKGMMARHEACPMMNMKHMKKQKKRKEKGMGGMQHQME